METLLVAGIDTVAGANIAATLNSEFHVVGISFSSPIAISGCQTTECDPLDADAATEQIAQSAPDWIVFCGPAAVSAWEVNPVQLAHCSLVDVAKNWAQNASDKEIPFTAVCSDAVFTGPWMFHDEKSNSYCDSAAARNLLKMEAGIIESHPQATLVRTHVFGWAPVEIENQSVTETLLKIEQGISFKGLSHASPIHASHLAEILEKLYRNEVTGVFHVGSSERVSPLRMADLLALEFGCSPPQIVNAGMLSKRPAGFTEGETSLQCAKIRSTLGIGLPLVSDGVRYLSIQKENGYCTRFVGNTAVPLEKVA